MKTPRTIQTKRTRPKSGFRMLHAATRATKKRKQRAATAAVPEDLGEVPGVGVARALVVILLLHVAAIAGIWLHNSWSKSADIKASVPALKGPLQPTPIAGLRRHTVSADDNYDSIASNYGVDRVALEKANEEKALQVGWVINIPNPPREIVRPSHSVAGGGNPPVEDEPIYTPQSRPDIQTSDTRILPGSEPGDLAEVEGTNKPILITPSRPAPAVENTPPSRGTRRHVVSSGDTLWGIANKNGISVDALKRANPNANVSALKIGLSLVIPARR